LKQVIKKLGPGFLFAGAAIGVSHLVQSTRAGADFGFGLLWALLLINAVKYPFFEFGPRYASATGKNLIDGYRDLGKPVLYGYFIITFATMFTIQTAVTIVTAGIATSLFGVGSIVVWTAIITGLCFTILIVGRYRFLDSLMKVVVLCLTLSTIIAVMLAFFKIETITLTQEFPIKSASILFLITFMGWMPAPLDISIWQSIWTQEKNKLNTTISIKQSKFDFNTGYVMTVILAIGFLSLGALVLYNSGEVFSNKGGEFANQLIGMYTSTLGENTKIVIAIAALTTMFSTTLTTLDASPRVMNKTTELLTGKKRNKGYIFWLIILIAGTLGIFFSY
jgi:Mn2+/Fe2+ NRAMP family transporter